MGATVTMSGDLYTVYIRAAVIYCYIILVKPFNSTLVKFTVSLVSHFLFTAVYRMTLLLSLYGMSLLKLFNLVYNPLANVP